MKIKKEDIQDIKVASALILWVSLPFIYIFPPVVYIPIIVCLVIIFAVDEYFWRIKK